MRKIDENESSLTLTSTPTLNENREILKPVYYIPETLNLEELLIKKGKAAFTKPVYLEKFYYILTILFLAKVVYRDRKTWAEHVNIHNRSLRNILTTRHSDELKRILLDDLKVIECDGEQINHIKSFGYRFAKKYRGVKFKKITEFSKLAPKLQKLSLKKRAEVIGQNELLAYIDSCVRNLNVDFEAASAYIATITEEKEKHNRELFLEWIHDNKEEGFFTRDKNGRVYHAMTSFPSELRKFCSFNEGAIFQTDVSNFHPALISRLYSEDSEEKAKFVGIVATGQFYLFLNRILGNKFDLKNPKEKKALKDLAFGEILYCHSFCKHTALQRAFEKSFPELYSILEASKKKNRTALPNEMMELEATIMIDCVAARFHQNFPEAPLFSIHDALCSTENFVLILDTMLREKLFETLGFSLITDVKRVSA